MGLSPWARLGLVWSVLILGGVLLLALSVASPGAPPWFRGAGALAMLGGALGWWRGRAEVRRALGRGDRWARERALTGANAYASLFVGAALVAALVLVVARHDRQLDLSSNRSNSLSPQTLSILRALKSDVRLTYAYAAGAPAPADLSLLEAYAAASPRVRHESFAAALSPARARSLGVRLDAQQRAVVLVQRVGSEEKEQASAQRGVSREVSVVDESNLSSAILSVEQATPRRVFLLEGHGEARLGREGGFLILARDLQAQNARLERLPGFPIRQSLPRGSLVLVLAPQSDLSPGEAAALGKYLSSGGRLALWIEPTPRPLARWKALAASLGLSWGEGIVADAAQSAFESPQNVLGLASDPNLGEPESEPVRAAILRGVQGSGVFAAPVPLQVAPTVPGRAVRPIYASSVQAQARDIRSGALLGRGPFILAAAVQRGESRAVVVSDAEFASDGASGAFGNRSLALACVNWALGEDALVQIPPRREIKNTLSMPSGAQAASRWISLVAVPAFFVLWGAWNRWRRR
jgi:hypothetical protein